MGGVFGRLMGALGRVGRVIGAACVLAFCLLCCASSAAGASPAFERVVGSPFAGAGGSTEAFSPDGRLLAAGVSIFLVSANGTLTPAPGPGIPNTDTVESSTFSPNGHFLAAADLNRDAVSMFVVSSAVVLSVVPGSPFVTGSQPESVAFSPDGSLLAVANFGSGSVSLFSVSSTGALSPVTGSPFATGAGPASVAFDSAGLLAVANYGAGTVSVYSASATNGLTPVPGSPFATGDGAGSMPPNTPSDHQEAVAFDASSDLLALANSVAGNVRLFSVSPSGALLQLAGSPIASGGGAPSAVAFSSTGLLAFTPYGAPPTGPASGSFPGYLYVYSFSPTGTPSPVAGSPFQTGPRPDAVAFSPDGHLLVTGNYYDGSASVFSDSIPPPAITGTPKPGSTLACSTGAAATSYQWSRNGTPIIGAINATYKVHKLDEGNTLTCTATDAVGQWSETSKGIGVPVPHVAGCPAATGTFSPSGVGPTRLGLTAEQERRELRRSSVRTHGYQLSFCLTPIAVRVGFPSPKLLAKSSTRIRRLTAARAIWILTGSARYAINDIRVGSTTAAAISRLRLGRPFRIGTSDWYFIRYGNATAIIEAQRGAIETIGVATRALTANRAGQRRLLRWLS